MSLSEKRHLHHEREESANLRQIYHSHEKSLLPAQSFFHPNKYGETRTRTKFIFLSQKRKSSRDLENEQIRILLGRQKEQILAEVRSEIQKHELQAESDRRSILELAGIIDSQRMEIDHTITRYDQSRRDQLLLQEEISEQNRDLRETCFRYMRDMEELQKKHVLKVEELPRRKMAEDFEEGTSFFQGSNVKTVHIIGDNDAKYPDAEIVDEHNRNSLASPLCFQEREASASLLQVYHSQRESLRLTRPFWLKGFVSLELSGSQLKPTSVFNDGARCMAPSGLKKKALSFRAVKFALRRQCGRELEQEVQWPVPQIQVGIVKLSLKQELSVDIPVPPGLEDIVEALQEVVKLVPQVRAQLSF